VFHPNRERNNLQRTQVLIIGGGITGAGLFRDLALRGVRCTLVEQKDLNAGASGANHGLLHSGARYVSDDPANARECFEENQVLKQVAAHCIEDTGGLFAAVEGDDENYVARFPELCARSGVPAEPVDVKEAREMEPVLSERLIAAYRVPDAAVDPFQLTLDNVIQAREMGCRLLRHTKVIGFNTGNGRIHATRLQNTLTGKIFLVEAEHVVNATGAWAARVSALAGIDIPMVYSKGSLLVTHSRLAERVINRLRPSSNADILVPGGTVSILGTTSVRIDNPDEVRPTVEEIDFIVEEGVAMIPSLESTRFIRAYSGVRPLVGSKKTGEDRGLSRGFALLDHAEQGLDNFTTITGGKLTTYRLMAEKTADLVCRRLGVSTPCATKTALLPSAAAARFTQPGFTPRLWLQRHEPGDVLLCECEMVSSSVVDQIVASVKKQGGRADLNDVVMRSRIGKGACQGTMCGLRMAAYLYDRGELSSNLGAASLKAFLNERWRGVRPLLWDISLIQSEFQEALYCGLFGLEL
jgi:glycerol-3-phosphate dehydrogenase